MGLKSYQRKRDFKRTPEPRGTVAATRGGNSFVIQKHAASRLHYDFRLELNGVLVSWAIPKGPSLDPKERRLAVHVEDHPVEYGGFEGVIPPEEYGGGTVLLWDRGRWTPGDDPTAGLRNGRLKFRLEGKKLRGGWTLVRMGGRAAEKGKENWLLIKEKDKEATPLTQLDILEERPESVASGLSMDEIGAARDREWTSKGQTKGKRASPKSKAKIGLRASHKDSTPRGRKGAARQNHSDEVAGVRLTNPDRVLYPKQGITKRELALFYEKIADWILPHLAQRPLTLVRCPEGHEKECFFQKHASESIAKSIHRVPIKEGKTTAQYLSVDSLAGLISLVQIGVLELHTWGSRADRLEQPDRMVFDLDPDPTVAWERMVEAAAEVRARLTDLGLESFLKTTGGKGLHVVVPIVRKYGWDEVKEFSRAIAQSLVRDSPGRYVATMSKAKRKGKIFIDYLRNIRGATAIAAYSTRARSEAPVSAPLRWDELGPKIRPDHFNLSNLPGRLARIKGDPWEGYEKTRRALTAAMRKKLGLK